MIKYVNESYFEYEVLFLEDSPWNYGNDFEDVLDKKYKDKNEDILYFESFEAAKEIAMFMLENKENYEFAIITQLIVENDEVVSAYPVFNIGLESPPLKNDEISIIDEDHIS